MIERRKILRETYSIHLSITKESENYRPGHNNSITEKAEEIEPEILFLAEKSRQKISIGEKPAKLGLSSNDLQSLVSKLEVLRSFSASTPDIVLAEQIAEAMLNEQENIGRGVENSSHELIHIVNLQQMRA